MHQNLVNKHVFCPIFTPDELKSLDATKNKSFKSVIEDLIINGLSFAMNKFNSKISTNIIS